MERRFFRRFKVRIPRKLKKAARYGVRKTYIPTTTEEKETAFGHTLHYTEKVAYVIIGKRTKWKVKACFACVKEYKRQLAYM